MSEEKPEKWLELTDKQLELINIQKQIRNLIKEKRYEEAIILCNNLLNDRDLGFWSHDILIYIYSIQENWEAAIEICEKALKLDAEYYPSKPLEKIHLYKYKNRLIELKNQLYHPEKIVTAKQILTQLLKKQKERKKPELNKTLNQIYDKYGKKLESVSLKWKETTSVNLSIKYELGLPLSGRDLISLSKEKNNIVIRDNVDAAISYLEEKIRSFEEEHKVDLLALVTENHTMSLGYNIPFWFLYSLRERMALVKEDSTAWGRELEALYYDFSDLGEFKVVIREWLKEAENFIRVAEGLPRIGEGFLNETRLYNIIRDNYEPLGYTVIHRAHPPFLGRQELDVYIPELKLGIEYQGKQHYESIDFFGGIKGLENRKTLDERKRQLCKEYGITLIEFKYDEEIIKNNILGEIKQYSPRVHTRHY